MRSSSAMERIIPNPYYTPHENPHIAHTAPPHYIHPQQYYHNTPPAMMPHDYGGPPIIAPLLQPHEAYGIITPFVYESARLIRYDNFGPPMAYISGQYQESQFSPSHYYLEGAPPLYNHNDSRSNHDNLVNYYGSLLDMIGRLIGNAAGNDARFSAETISRNLKTSLYGEKGSERDGGEKDVCAVCLDEFEKNQKIGTLQCGHEYHADCIHKWLLQKNTCPTCRGPPWR